MWGREGEVITCIFTSYILTLLIAKSHIFGFLRNSIRIMIRMISNGNFAKLAVMHVPYEAEGGGTLWLLTDEQVAEHPEAEGFDFISCRLCVGFWVTILVVRAFGMPLESGLLIYGASYFLSTQERD